ncbi:hypothetical protein GQ53DRAFT_847078 [Thozetella sp. PMI_491]|nr:hypothetical protein GQ53DRAFT_847078 [Thozetella sp. PMI_491]
MAVPTRPPANGFVAAMRKVYNPLGFSKGYNFTLFFIFWGALMGFTLARLQYMSIFGVFCGPNGSSHGAPGECFYYSSGHEKIGITLHLVTILPASFLACFQFVPVIRHRVILFHRINGYVVIILGVASTAGAFMIARHAFGGGLDTQIGVGLLGILFLFSLALAYYNVKKLQLEQHRAWMLRAWFYAGSIITLRLIQIIATVIISGVGGYYSARPCSEIAYVLKGQKKVLADYPECGAYYNGSSPGQNALVLANYKSNNPVEIAAALGINFGPALWLAFAIHAIGIELYLHLTPAESERLRNVSYQRQIEAGMRNPGNAGLTVQRLGDAKPWIPDRPEAKPEASSDPALTPTTS